jgi:hypothetical protein
VAGEPTGVDVGRGRFVGVAGFGFIRSGDSPNHEAPVANVGGTDVGIGAPEDANGLTYVVFVVVGELLSGLASDEMSLTESET